MNEQIQAIQSEVESFLISNEAELEQFRVAFVGRKGRIAALFDGLKDVPAENRREVGQVLNALKTLPKVNLRLLKKPLLMEIRVLTFRMI